MSRWSDKLAASRGHKTKTANKYGAVRTSCGLHSHMSKGEAEFCGELQLLERTGAIEIEKVQPNVILVGAIRVIPDWLIRRITVAPAGRVYIDFKGFSGQSWRRNRTLWKQFGPLPLEVWKKNHKGFFLSETIQGKEGE